MNKIFSVPGGITDHVTLVDAVTLLYSEKRDLFLDDIEIGCVYDSFSGVWSGGRAFNINKQQDYSVIKDTIQKFNDRGIGFRQIFTNLFIHEHLEDERCNTIMDLLSNGVNNSVVLASDTAFSVLKERYPNLTFGSSVIKGLYSKDLIIEELNKEYDDVCIWHKFNTVEFLGDLNTDLKSKITLLTNQICNPSCDRMYLCGLRASIFMLEQYNIDVPQKYKTLDRWCPQEKAAERSGRVTTAKELFSLPWVLTNEKIRELSEIGITRFKITGRNGYFYSEELLKVFLYYLVKPCFYEDFIKEITDIVNK